MKRRLKQHSVQIKTIESVTQANVLFAPFVHVLNRLHSPVKARNLDAGLLEDVISASAKHKVIM